MYKHLTIEQRILIEDRLNKQKSVRSIAKELAVAPSTILREIKRHITIYPASANDCKHKRDCPVNHVCGDSKCNKTCAKCKIHNCVKICPDYKKYECSKQKEAPYLCNGCKSVNLCHLERRIYKGSYAEEEYKDTLVSARTGFDLTEQEISKVDQLASPLLMNGLSPYHVKQTYGDELPISESTLRRMIDGCAINARNIDLRDKVKRRPRGTTRNAARNRALSISKVGHLYEDYLRYVEETDVFTVEMDCVEGSKDDPAVLLTLTWRELSFQVAIILTEQNPEMVVDALDKIEESLGTELFRKVFPLILTDNGQEFTHISDMETSNAGGKRTKVFFCEPNRSDQKGTCENHHKMIRYCIPKGTALGVYDQFDISLMMNHVNSYKRRALFGKSAFDLAKDALPEDFFILLGLEEIPPGEIILSPKLFHHSKRNR